MDRLAETFSVSYDRLENRVRICIYNINPDYKNKEDACQEVMIRLWRCWHRIVDFEEVRLRKYTFIVTRNYLYDEYRRAKQRRKSVNAFASGRQPIFFEDQSLLKAGLQGYVDLIDRLPQKRRSVFILNANGESRQEIAEKLGVSEHTIRNHIGKARKTVRLYFLNQFDIDVYGSEKKMSQAQLN